MKKRNLRYLFLLALSGQVFFSCNTARHYEFANHGPAYKSEKVKTATPQETIAPANTNTATVQEPNAPAAETITASTEIAPLAAKPLVDLKAPAATQETPVLAAPTATEIAALKLNVNREQKKEIKNALKQFRKQNIQDNQETAKPAVNIIELIFAILLPPVGVLLHEGGLNSRFWISLLLTLLFFIPGMIYAILVVTDTI